MGWVFPIVWNEQTSAPTPANLTWGMSERGVVREGSWGWRIQVSVEHKMLSVDCKDKAEMKSALLTADWQFQRATRKYWGVVEDNNNNNLLHLYSAFLDTQSALHSKGTISSSTTNVQHPPGWCDGSHSAPERPPHTSLLVERRQSDEANQCMGMIRRPWWSEASGLVWPGCRGNTPTLFWKTSWDF